MRDAFCYQNLFLSEFFQKSRHRFVVRLLFLRGLFILGRGGFSVLSHRKSYLVFDFVISLAKNFGIYFLFY